MNPFWLLIFFKGDWNQHQFDNHFRVKVSGMKKKGNLWVKSLQRLTTTESNLSGVRKAIFFSVYVCWLPILEEWNNANLWEFWGICPSKCIVWVGFISWPLHQYWDVLLVLCKWIISPLNKWVVFVPWIGEINQQTWRSLLSTSSQTPDRRTQLQMFLRGASEWGTTADQYKDWCGFWHGSLQVLYQGTGVSCFREISVRDFCSYYSWDEWYNIFILFYIY